MPYRADMSGDPAPDRGSPGPASSHLDTDPEALEDPVHRGDATHRHEAHLGEAAARAEAEATQDGTAAAGNRDDGEHTWSAGERGAGPGGPR